MDHPVGGGPCLAFLLCELLNLTAGNVVQWAKPEDGVCGVGGECLGLMRAWGRGCARRRVRMAGGMGVFSMAGGLELLSGVLALEQRPI